MLSSYNYTEQTELELKIKKFVIRRTKALIASQLPKKGVPLLLFA